MTDFVQLTNWGSADPLYSARLNKWNTDVYHLKETCDRGMTLAAGTAAVGSLVVMGTATDQVQLTASAGQTGPVWVALETLTAGSAAAQVRLAGAVTLTAAGSVGIGDYLQTSGTAGVAARTTDTATAFAIATSAAGTAGGPVSVVLLPRPPESGGGGGGGGGSGSLLWDPYSLAVPPVASDLSVHDHWSGSGITTALTQQGDAVVFKNPASAASFLERGAFGTNVGPLAVPAPPYTVTVCFIPNIYPINFWAAALALRESGNDKRINARVVYDTGVIKIDGVNLTDYQTASSAFGSQVWPLTFPIWLRIRDDTANLYWEVCKDGQWFVAYTSGSTGAFCTPDQAGITMNSNGGGSGGVASMTVLSLSVVNPA